MLPKKNNQDLTSLKNQFYSEFAEDVRHLSLNDQTAIFNNYVNIVRSGKGVDLAKAKLAYGMTPQKYSELPAKTFADCFTDASPLFSTLVKYRGRVFTLILIQSHFSKLMRAFDAKYGMDEETIQDLAEDFLDDYFYLRVSDLKFFIRKAKRKQFGENFSNLSLATILSWLEVYTAWRGNESERKSIGTHNEIMNDTDSKVSTEAIQKAYARIKKEAKEPVVKKKDGIEQFHEAYDEYMKNPVNLKLMEASFEDSKKYNPEVDVSFVIYSKMEYSKIYYQK